MSEYLTSAALGHVIAGMMCSTRARRSAGLKVSTVGRFLRNQLLERQIGNRLSKPGILDLPILRPSNLIRIQATELMSLTVVYH